MWSTPIFASDSEQTSSTPDSSKKFIAAPWASASTDEGIAVGFTAGISKFPNLLVYSSLQTSTKGYSSISLQVEMGNERVNNLLNGSASHVIRYAYNPYIDKPKPFARATVNRYQVRYSRLYQTSDPLEIGPDFMFDYSSGRSITDPDGRELPLDFGWYNALLRFEDGMSITAGVRARYATMSTNRPLNGHLVDAAFRLGSYTNASGHLNNDHRMGEIRFAIAHPISKRSRIYVRVLGQSQGNASPPIQNHLGGESTIRGEPSQRDFGLQLLCGRAQYHFTVLEDWGFPLRLAHRIWSIFPVWAMDVEAVCFYDIGSVESDDHPNLTWLKTRQGYGGGLRFVIPPELVLFFDIAKSPYCSPRFYLGVGETL